MIPGRKRATDCRVTSVANHLGRPVQREQEEDVQQRADRRRRRIEHRLRARVVFGEMVSGH